jgi:hypothetical protein
MKTERAPLIIVQCVEFIELPNYWKGEITPKVLEIPHLLLPLAFTSRIAMSGVMVVTAAVESLEAPANIP